MIKQTVSKQTQKNWWIDSLLFCSAITATLSGIYFLYMPTGFQGGRNPWYNIQILFSRGTWDDLHTWGGIAMIALAVVHLAIHWQWITNMSRRIFKELTGQSTHLNSRGRWNLILNIIVAISFLLTTISGIYFLFVPGGRWAADPFFLFSRNIWDLIHTWASVTLISAAIIHFAIHWKWITKVTRSMAGVVVYLPATNRINKTT